MKENFDLRPSLEKFFKKKGVKAVFMSDLVRPQLEKQKALDLSELTQRDH